MTDRAVLLFDAGSELCRTSVRWVARHDRRGRIRPVPMGSTEGQDLLASVPPRLRDHSWHLLLDGQVYSGREVLDPLLDLLDRPLAGRFLKRAMEGMGRTGQSRAGAEVPVAPSQRTAPEPSEPSAGGNGAPSAGPDSPPHPRPAPSPPEPRPVEREPGSVPPERVPAAPAVGLMERPAPVRAPAMESPPVVEAPKAAPQVERAPGPEPPEETEAPDWQSRFERSPFGRGILSVLILITLIAIVAINLPNSDLRRIIMKPGQPYLNALGLDQAWGVFAPDPRRSSIDVSGVVTYDDGRVAQWTLPRNGALIGSYTDYRWGKWEEFLIQPGVGSSLWLPAAQWVASQEVRPGHAIKRVVLVERYRQLFAPGVTPSQGPTQRVVFYSLSLPGAAQRGAQPQAPLPPGGGGL